mgnify:CR=1 FL=1
MSKGRLGVIGCGQLSQMLGEAANRLGYSVTYLCVDETPVVEGLGSVYFPNELDTFRFEVPAHTATKRTISIPDYGKGKLVLNAPLHLWEKNPENNSIRTHGLLKKWKPIQDFQRNFRFRV